MHGNDQPQPASAVFNRLRREYTHRGLDEQSARSNPLDQFTAWLYEAVDARIVEPNAMVLATADAQGRPAARTVLLKDFDERGFVFFTNYESQKGRELNENPRASLVFLWKELERQVRVDGPVQRVSREESETYFRSRPFEARLGAWASPQSRPVAKREALEGAFEALRARYASQDVPLPPYWGGYRVQHQELEFWQGRPNRLHDRLLYTREAGGWSVRRLAP